MSKRESKLYLQDIVEAVNKIEEYTRGLSFETFSEDQKSIDAVVRNLEVIGQAARNIPEEVVEKYPDIPWGRMVSMRNKVLHEYFGVDLGILWQTIHEDLPGLKEKIEVLPELS